MQLLRLVAALALACASCGKSDAQPTAEDSKVITAEVEPDESDEPQPPDLAQHVHPLLVWTAWEVEKDYFDKARLDPRAQLLAATEALGLHTPEFFAEASGDVVKVRVRSASSDFALDDLDSLLAAATRLEEILVFAQGVLDLEPEPLHELEYAAINGMFGPLDPHTVLLTPEQHADLGVRTKGEFGGIGAQIRVEARRIVIVSVLPGMPAALQGLLAGDVILMIDGESTVNLSAEEAQQRLRGPVGSKVKLRLQRGKKQLGVEVERSTIKIESVRATRLPDGVAYLGVSAFQEETAAEARAGLEKLGAGLTGLVLDMRGNSGGVLAQATEMVDDLVTRGELVIVRSAAGDEVAEAEEGTAFPIDAPIVVLIDQESASAAEIVSGGLQALGRAVVVGRTTFGKGTVQMVRPAAPYGQELALKLTLAEYLVAGAQRIQSIGVVPDLVLQPVEPTGVPGIVRFFDEERFERARERSRAAGLPSARHDVPEERSDRDAPRLHYLHGDRVPDALLHGPDGEPRTVPDELRDPEVRLAFAVARGLSGNATGAGRKAALERVTAELRTAEDERVVQALAADDVDWTAGPAGAAAPKLRITAALTRTGPIPAGEPFGLELVVHNDGTTAAHRVHAITDCVHDELDGIEVLIGHVPAGASVKRELKLHVMPWHADFTDELAVALHVGEPTSTPAASASTLFEVEGANRPELAYDYWIVDDPALVDAAPDRPAPEPGTPVAPFTVAGNGDGMLQPGERVLVAYVAKNVGKGPSPDVRALVRNLSGRQGLLEEGFAELGALAPGATKAGAFGLTVADDADVAHPLELEIVVGDAKLRTSVQDKLRFRVLPSSPALVPGRAHLRVDGESARLYDGAHPSAAIVATAATGAELDVVATVGGFRVVEDAAHGRRMFLPADLDGLAEATGKGTKGVVPRMPVLPPRVDIDATPRMTNGETVELRGAIVHPERARDVVVLVRPPGASQRDRKIHFGANDATEGEAARTLRFVAQVPLAPGGNRITVLARDGAKVVHRRDLWVYRQSAR